MSALNWDESTALAVLRAMKTVATDGGLTDPDPIERQMLVATAEHVLHVSTDVDALDEITPSGLADSVDPLLAVTAMQFVILMPYMSTRVEPREVELVDVYAAQLGVSPVTLADLHQVQEGRFERWTYDYTRRLVNRVQPYEGLRGWMRTITHALHEYAGDHHVARRYQALVELPDGTLGRELYEFYRAREFPLPGEPGGYTEILVPHDITHVLAGCNTGVHGECEVAGFEAGMARTGLGYEMMLEVLIYFHLGVDIASSFGLDARVGEFQPRPVMACYERGVRCNRDLISDWDYWPDLDRAVSELRDEFDIVDAGPVRMPEPDD